MRLPQPCCLVHSGPMEVVFELFSPSKSDNPVYMYRPLTAKAQTDELKKGTNYGVHIFSWTFDVCAASRQQKKNTASLFLFICVNPIWHSLVIDCKTTWKMQRTIIVAVCVPCSPPPQHSPILGHRASSHTVANFSSRNCVLILLKFAPIGISFFSHGGKRRRSFSPFSRFNLPSYAFHSTESRSGFWTKSWKLGPLARRSRIASNDFDCE